MNVPWEKTAGMITAGSAFLAALINYLSQHVGLARKTNEIEVVVKRVQLIEELLKLDLSDETRNPLKNELTYTAKHLIAERARERTAIDTDFEGLPILRRALLVYQQPTLRASVYRGLFWLFLSISVWVCLSVLVVVLSIGSPVWPIALFGGVVYFAISLVFRALAIHQLKLAKARAAFRLSSDLRG